MGQIKKRGFILINLGTPTRLTFRSISHFLKNFLSDKKVVQLPRWLWLPILYGLVLPLRTQKLKRAYGAIWHRETDESPLRYYTRRQSELLAGHMSSSVTWAMRYGTPSIKARVQELMRQGCDHIVMLPLYPQYAESTTGSVLSVISKLPEKPIIQTLPAYYKHPAYIHALAQSLHTFLKGLSWQPDAILLSFHSLPLKEIARGDPYEAQCSETARLLQDQFPHLTFHICYQSRFGSRRWLGPATLLKVRHMAQLGIHNLVVLCPGFASDCLETLEEIDRIVYKAFRMHGGQNFARVPCLNDTPFCIDMLYALLSSEDMN